MTLMVAGTSLMSVWINHGTLFSVIEHNAASRALFEDCCCPTPGPCNGECAYIWEELSSSWLPGTDTCTIEEGCVCADPPERDGDFDEELVTVDCLAE